MLKFYFASTSLRTLPTIMRIILFCLSLFLAIAHPVSSHIQSDLSSSKVVITEQKSFSLKHPSEQGNLTLVLPIIDIDEDDITDSERKIIPLTKNGSYNVTNTSHTYSEKNFPAFNRSTYYFQLHPSLFLFIGSFRL